MWEAFCIAVSHATICQTAVGLNTQALVPLTRGVTIRELLVELTGTRAAKALYPVLAETRLAAPDRAPVSS